jgi:hypothetical protein
MSTKIIALVRLVGLASSALSFAAGCDEGDHGCPEGKLCVDVGVLRGSTVSVYVTPDEHGNDSVSVSMTLPRAYGGLCYNVPDDLVARANDGPPARVGVSYDSGHTISFSSDCPSEQRAGASFIVPAGPEPITITFARGDSAASLIVDRAPRPPVDVVLSTTRVAEPASFAADLTPRSGTLPTEDACWTAYLHSDDPQFGASLSTTVTSTGSGVHLDFAFPSHEGAADLPPGGAQLFMWEDGSEACGTVQPGVSCPGFRGCTIDRSARTLGPYRVEIL